MSWLPGEVWDKAVDESLPEGVIALQDGDGLWWRYPLVEFEEPRDTSVPA